MVLWLGAGTENNGLAGSRPGTGTGAAARRRERWRVLRVLDGTIEAPSTASGMKGNSLLVPAPGFSFYGDFVCLAYFGSVVN